MVLYLFGVVVLAIGSWSHKKVINLSSCTCSVGSQQFVGFDKLAKIINAREPYTFYRSGAA
jgi:hypothetical protein